jgi:hypothetical protein
MELCDGRDWRSLERRYYAAIEPLRRREAAKAELQQALDELIGMGIVEVTPKSRSQKAVNTGRGGTANGT